MKRITIVSTLYNIPGINQLVIAYANQLVQKEDVSVSVVFPLDDERSDDIDSRVSVFRIPWVSKLKGISVFMRIRAYVKTLSRLKSDVYHFFNEGFYSIQIAKRITTPQNKLICTIHDVILHSEKRSLTERFFLAMSSRERLEKVFDLFHVHGERDRQQLQQLLKKPIYTANFIPFYSSTLVHGDQIPMELELIDTNRKQLLFFGRIHPYKGLKQLIEGFRLQNEWDLIIAGNGTIDFELPPSGITVINRFIQNTEVKAIFEACDVVVLPYIDATHSGVLFMAALFKKPVIVSKVGSLDNYVCHGENGWFFSDIHSPQSVMVDIQLLLKVKLREAGQKHYDFQRKFAQSGCASHLEAYEN